MANQHGDFLWYELLTADPEAAARFYGAVIGWESRPAEGFDNYRIVRIDGQDVGGLLTVRGSECAGMRLGWLGYIAVENVDAAAAGIVRAGGVQHVPPTNIPGVGRFAMLTDPQGAMFSIMRGAVEGTSMSFAPDKRGHCHWNELATGDQQAALAFYRANFGWEQGDAMPMGAMGDYRFIAHHGTTIGAVMNRMPGGPPVLDLLLRRRRHRRGCAGRIRERGHDPSWAVRSPRRRLHRRRQRSAGSPFRTCRTAPGLGENLDLPDIP